PATFGPGGPELNPAVADFLARSTPNIRPEDVGHNMQILNMLQPSLDPRILEAQIQHGGVKEAAVHDVLKASGINPLAATPEQITQARAKVRTETERAGKATLNAAMEVVTKGAVDDLTRGAPSRRTPRCNIRPNSPQRL